jgi:homoaconitate hydratase
VIAGSYSQTYLRNAFNNGFVCIDCPALVDRLKQRFSDTESPTLIPGDLLDIDFARGTVTLGEEVFSFAPLGAVPQALVVAGGIENQIRARLGVEA